MIHLNTILHPTDFSEGSRYALELAASLARDQAARVILLHVVPRLGAATGDYVPPLKEEHTEEDLKAYRAEMADLLREVQTRAPCARVESLLKEGDVTSVILRTAEETPCDLIVMGTHGKSRMFQLMMGSVAGDVTRRASCPVVTVRIPPRGSAEKSVPKLASLAVPCP